MRVLGGRYRLDERIGTGGTAEVWRGYDLVLERTVAVKMLAAALAADPRAGARARMEALAAARLTHPNVAAVYDFGQSRIGLRTSHPYIVMEFVDGETLQTRLRRDGALHWHSAATICSQVAVALAAAHERGMVHRDVKPGNVMLTAARVKVVDFGIAAAIGQAQTETGEILLGTPLYMAPEQLRGDPVVPASDVYALGLLLYECLTGRRPWPDGSPADIALARVDHLVPSPLPIIDGLPDALAQLCRNCLDDAPGERPTALDAATVLAETVNAEPAEVYPTVLGTVVASRSPLPGDSSVMDRLQATTVSGRLPLRATAGAPDSPAGSPATMARGQRAWWPLRTRVSVAAATAITVTLAAMAVTGSSTDWSLGSLVDSGASADGVTSGCVTRYAAREHRDGVFTATLTVTNTGDDERGGWSLTFTLPTGHHLATMDGAHWTSVGTEVTLHGDTALAGGAAATLALTGTYLGSGRVPSGFTLDGVGCRQENSIVRFAGAPAATTRTATGAPSGPAVNDAPAPASSARLTPPASPQPSPSAEPSAGLTPSPDREPSASSGPETSSPTPSEPQPSSSSQAPPDTRPELTPSPSASTRPSMSGGPSGVTRPLP